MKMIKNKIAYIRPLVSSLPKVMTVPACTSACVVAAAATAAGAAARIATKYGSSLLSDSSVRIRGIGHKGRVELSV